MPFLRILPVALLTLIVGNLSVADMVTIIPMPPDWPMGANANALAGPLFDSDIDVDDIGGPAFGSVTASKLGNTATHSYAVETDYSMGPAYFDSSYSDFLRTSTDGHRASAESIFFFMVDTPTMYESMGFFAVDDADGTTVPGNVELEIELLDITDEFDPITKLYSYQVSKSTIDQAFEVGAMDGDFANVLDGDVMGMLEPGKLYRYRTLVTINAIDIDGGGPLPPTDGFASAFGEHTLLIGHAPIPEPNTAGIMACSLAMVGLIRYRRRR